MSTQDKQKARVDERVLDDLFERIADAMDKKQIEVGPSFICIHGITWETPRDIQELSRYLENTHPRLFNNLVKGRE